MGSRDLASRASRWWLLLLAAAVCVIALLFVTKWTKSDTGAGPVVLISIDTLRADRLPTYGYAAGTTPHVDRVAADGAVFESAWSQSPQTLPSHTSILTGLLPFEHGVRDNIGFSLKAGTETLATRFKSAGYATAAFVSSYVLRRHVGLAAGFDVYDDMLPPATAETPLGEMQRPGSATAEAAIRWMHAQPSSNYFLFFHIYEPHTPYTPPVIPSSGDRYNGEVTHADQIVGTVIDALRQRGEYDKATIVVTSDHGEGLGDHGEDEHGIFLYRTTIQVPLVIKRPEQPDRGRRIATPVQHIDVLPTLLEVAALPAATGVRGRSLTGLLSGTASIPPAPIYAEAMSARYHFGWSELYSLTDERYRLIRAPRAELFDLQSDPRETRSVGPERAPVVAAMQNALDDVLRGAAVDTPSAVSAADRQRLAALGYVGSQSSPRSGNDAERDDPKDKVDVLRRYQQAAALGARQRWREAADAFRALVQVETDMVDAWLQLAQSEERAGNRAGALDAYRAVLSREGKNAAALTGAAAVLVTLGQFDAARAHAELAEDVAPAQAHELLARLALQRGDVDAARSHATQAAAADPSLPLPDFVEGLILYNQGAYAASIAPLRRAAEALARRTEQVADVRYVLADALARQEQLTEAERWFVAEIRDFPGHVRARAGLAMVLWTSGRRAEAVRAVEALETSGSTIAGSEADGAAAQLWQLFGEPGRAAAARNRASRRR